MANMRWLLNAWSEDSDDLKRIVKHYQTGEWPRLYQQLDWLESVAHLLRTAAVEDELVLGKSWAEIGEDLGVSKQAAWARFRYLRQGDREPDPQLEIHDLA